MVVYWTTENATYDGCKTPFILSLSLSLSQKGVGSYSVSNQRLIFQYSSDVAWYIWYLEVQMTFQGANCKSRKSFLQESNVIARWQNET